jgi:hypothetical protein
MASSCRRDSSQAAAGNGGSRYGVFGETSDSTLHGFWPKFRDLKERVRTASAIKLEAKLDLERRLRSLGSRAYKAQEGAYAQSGERKTNLLTTIQDLRQRAEAAVDPRDLRTVRREVDAVRQRFDRERVSYPQIGKASGRHGATRTNTCGSVSVPFGTTMRLFAFAVG